MKHKVKLFIHDSFLSSFADLPKKIQKKTRSFMEKFKEDPTSSAINYEKISTFSDQSLRTVRIDQKYRAIVQAPNNGNGYHLLWVDNHDEAMDWAKSKVFEWNENIQSFQMYNRPEEIKEVEPKRELLFDQYTNEDLTAIGIPHSLLGLVKKIGSTEELEQKQNNLPIDAYEYLYYLAQGISLDEILEEINSGKSSDDEEYSANAQKHVYALTEDDDLEAILSGDFEKWKIFLHPSQRELAYKDFNGSVKVTGGAGTGKTVTAIHRAKYLAGKLDIFQKPVLFTTFTTSLTKYLKHIAADLGISNEYLFIQNFDKLIVELAKDDQFGIMESGDGYINSSQERELWQEVIEYHPSRFDETFLMDEYNDVILRNRVNTPEVYLKTSRVGRNVRIGRKDKLEVWNLVQEFQKRKGANFTKLELCSALISALEEKQDKPFSHVICDELQDFSQLELSLMRALVEERENDMFLVGDPFQNIYGKQINFSKSGINVRGRRSRKLKVNYRTTEEIRKEAIKVIEPEQFENFDGEEESTNGYISLMHGIDPEYQVFEIPEEEDHFVMAKVNELLHEDDSSPSEICLSGRTNKVVDQIKHLLHKNDLKYQDLNSQKEIKNSIKVSTFHDLKGHEFKFLFVVGVSEDNVPLRHQAFHQYDDKQREEYIKQERSLYYVVFSRAIQGLWITGVGEKSSWF